MRGLILLALLCPAALPAQGRAPEEPLAPERFGETVDVRVINIETVVTDREGNRVPGLTREDFRLLVDGQEVPIGYFTEIRDGRATVTFMEGDAGTTTEAASERVPTNYLVFVDDFFAIGAHRNLVLAALGEQLGGLDETDSVALVAYDGRRATMLLDWSGDPEAIRRGLEAASQRRARGAHRVAEARMFSPVASANADGDLEGTLDPPIVGSLLAGAGDAYYPLVARQIERLVAAVAASLRGSLPPPGRRVALLVAGGWASGPLLHLQDHPVAGVAGRELLEKQDQIREAALWYQPLVDTANLLGFTLYPIDAPGAGWGGPSVGNDATTAGFGSAERDLEYTLEVLARATGGRPLLNGLRTAALETAIEDTRSYYWIGFDAPREGSGRFHGLQVELRRPGLSARSRSSFVDLSRRAEAEWMVEAGLILGTAEEMGDLEAEFSSVTRGERPRTVEVLLHVRVPFGDLELLPVNGRLTSVLELSLGVRDKHGRSTDIFTYPLELEIGEPPPPLASARIPIRVVLSRMKHDLVVTVRDAVGGGVFMRRLAFDPKTTAKAAAGEAPL